MLATNRSATLGVRSSPRGSSWTRDTPSNSITGLPNTVRCDIGCRALAAAADCGLIGWSCAQLTFEVSQPLRIEAGRFTTTLADAPLSYEDPLTYSTRRFSASPDGREIDLRLGLEKALSGERRLTFRGGVALQPAGVYHVQAGLYDTALAHDGAGRATGDPPMMAGRRPPGLSRDAP